MDYAIFPTDFPPIFHVNFKNLNDYITAIFSFRFLRDSNSHGFSTKFSTHFRRFFCPSKIFHQFPTVLWPLEIGQKFPTTKNPSKIPSEIIIFSCNVMSIQSITNLVKTLHDILENK